MSILAELKERFRVPLRDLLGAAGQAADDADTFLEMIRPAQNPHFGDYQANFAMPLAKKVGRSPQELARNIADAARLEDLCESREVVGPGFLNLRIREEVLKKELTRAGQDPRLGIKPTSAPKKYVVDFSSPNVAKAMHVGHIRSTVIGDAIARVLRFMGHEVVTDNHLGDWGTQFGMIIYGYKHFVDPIAYAANPVNELTRLYKFVRATMDGLAAKELLPKQGCKIQKLETLLHDLNTLTPGDKKQHAKDVRRVQGDLAEAKEEFQALEAQIAALDQDLELASALKEHADIRQAVLDETAALHAGDRVNVDLWKKFLPACRQDIQRIYDRLHVQFDVELGESFYHNKLAGVVQSLESRGLASESEGATCVFLEGFETPMLIRKRDGEFLYSTSDLATIEYRVATWNPDAILYVVDFRQGEHFAKLFAAARLWGYDRVDLRHLQFGTVLGEDNRPYKTRSGDTVGLEGLLDEAERRALAVVREHNDSRPPAEHMSEAQRAHIAHIVGIAAIKYADLSQNRTSDYVFSYDKMLSLQGNTATSMQYSYARVQGIFEKGALPTKASNVPGESAESATPRVNLIWKEPIERQLSLKILQFGESLDEMLVDFRPNVLAAYLYDLSKSFAQFFDACPVLKAESEALRESRLVLCDLTARTIKTGLELLGIEVVSQM